MSLAGTRIITLGSRPSQLARWQTEWILNGLKKAHPEFSYRVVTLITEGDRKLDRPLPAIGGKGLFTAELERALLQSEIDLAVHSLKDLPTQSSPELTIGAISARADPRDVIISARKQTLQTLPTNARVGTSSLRREAQLKHARPDLAISPLRGNIDTRLRKALEGQYDAIVMAAAGVERLGLNDAITGYLPLDVMLPAPGQGALAVQCRANDLELLDLLLCVHDESTRRAVTAERAFLAALGSGCSAPVAAYAQASGQILEMTGLVASVDGQQIIRVQASGEDPERLGQQLALQAVQMGAEKLLR